jgi:hypothetical protein
VHEKLFFVFLDFLHWIIFLGYGTVRWFDKINQLFLMAGSWVVEGPVAMVEPHFRDPAERPMLHESLI